MATIETPETQDQVIKEVRRVKEALAAECDYDVAKIVAQAKENQARASQ